jgi:hypothetical protein
VETAQFRWVLASAQNIKLSWKVLAELNAPAYMSGSSVMAKKHFMSSPPAQPQHGKPKTFFYISHKKNQNADLIKLKLNLEFSLWRQHDILSICI